MPSNPPCENRRARCRRVEIQDVDECGASGDRFNLKVKVRPGQFAKGQGEVIGTIFRDEQVQSLFGGTTGDWIWRAIGDGSLGQQKCGCRGLSVDDQPVQAELADDFLKFVKVYRFLDVTVDAELVAGDEVTLFVGRS